MMVWVSVAADFPSSVNVPPLRFTEPVLARTFEAFVVKSRVTPPALMLRPPVKVFRPWRVKVPVPTLATEPAPLTTPAKVVLALLEPMRALSVPTKASDEPVAPARPPRLKTPRPEAIVPAAPVMLRLRVPEPAALALPKAVVPAPEIVRPPVKVLLPERVTVFAAVPWRVSAKLPMIGPLKALAFVD